MTPQTPWQHTLVFAIAHEIGNHLSAIRLQAHLLGLGDENLPKALAETSIEIDSLAGRVAPLLALLRPILSPAMSPVTSAEGPPSGAVSWSGLLEALGRQIENEGTRGVQVDILAPADPQARAPAVDWLQPLVMALVGSTLDAASESGKIVLETDLLGDEALLVLEDDAAEEDLSAEAPLCGRPLCVSIARRLLASSGGHVKVIRVEDRTRIELVFPQST